MALPSSPWPLVSDPTSSEPTSPQARVHAAQAEAKLTSPPSIGPVLPLRACRGTHRPRPPTPKPSHIQHHHHPSPARPIRPIPHLALPPQHLLAPRLRQQPAPLPDCQTHRSTLHSIMYIGSSQPLAMVPPFLEATASVPAQRGQLAPAVPG